jgi:hypothetical protein
VCARLCEACVHGARVWCNVCVYLYSPVMRMAQVLGHTQGRTSSIDNLLYYMKILCDQNLVLNLLRVVYICGQVLDLALATVLLLLSTHFSVCIVRT